MYTVSDSVRSTNSQDGATILDIRQGQIFNLNFVGSRIFELLKSGLNESQIVEEISDKFIVSRDVAAVDVREFLQVLIAKRLIEDHPA